MRKIFLTVVAALVVVGAAFSTKAVNLLKSTDVSISQNKDRGLVLKHASQIFGESGMLLATHGSHGSHGSHASHASHSSHYSST